MNYELMFPDQIRRSIAESWPVVLPVGVLEYHGEHCAVGVDTLVITRAVELLEKEISVVALPALTYGPASYAVEPPEGNGTLHVDSRTLCDLAGELLRGLLRVGFRNIHAFVHHQVGDFQMGMPTDLAIRLAARQAVFEFQRDTAGEGWWGRNKTADGRADPRASNEPFEWIKVHPFMDAKTQEAFPGDHAGMLETSLMMAFCPEGVDMGRLSQEKWYCRDAGQASEDCGRAAKDMILAHMRRAVGS